MLLIMPQIYDMAPEVKMLKMMVETIEFEPVSAIACAYSTIATYSSVSSFFCLGSFKLIKT